MTRARDDGRPGRVHVVVTDGRGRSHPFSRSLVGWLERHAPRSARGTVAIALVTDARMKTLNRTFRGVDKPTDVLSFPAEPTPRRPALRRAQRAPSLSRGEGRHIQGRSHVPRPTSQDPHHLGDLAIALGVAGRQARAEGHYLGTELRILALHGLLHLLGYDHERDRGTMRALEDRLRRRAGLPAGLITRAPVRPLHR